jgi:S-formylglutathione hydrolase FrmB
MALFQVHFMSRSLNHVEEFHVYVPNDTEDMFINNNPHYERPTKTLYLLNGFSGSTMSWLLGSPIMEISRRYNLAIVLPSGSLSFYIDRKGTGNRFETYVAKELREYVCRTFGLSDKRQDSLIGGNSMGGFGALRLGMKYEDQYQAIIALSPAMVTEDIQGLKPEDTESGALQLADYDYYEMIFGDLSNVKNTDKHPEYIIRQKLAEGKTLPSVFMACGTEDILLQRDRAFAGVLKELHVDAEYRESSGEHDWKFWSNHIEEAVAWALQK